MAAKSRKHIATFCRALAARLDPQPAAPLYQAGPVYFGGYATASDRVHFTVGGSQ
jgi:hypothetical protein